jgi:hypothetical protein
MAKNKDKHDNFTFVVDLDDYDNLEVLRTVLLRAK